MSLNAKRPDDVYAALFTFMDPSSSPATVQLILSDKTAFHLFSPACLSPRTNLNLTCLAKSSHLREATRTNVLTFHITSLIYRENLSLIN